ncbi:hypothetical protein [Fulvivirga ligni]|uniref:hypothetical protein n=1 Tax=Fulvivirga ligni TaxID=2904246 RepID=UPI001F4456F5|nr:hypothetical protein [Fulvivirga ligni]UII22463.1 hypothetical protein LVD16_04370 [Fulvivirga ligni]
MRYTALFFILLLAACTKPEKDVSYYYNIDSLLSTQKALLLSKGAVIKKSAMLSGDTAQAEIHPDSALWDKEFKIFDNININKPTLQGMYDEKVYADSNSNLQVKSYTANNDDAQVKSLKIYYLNNLNNIRKVEAEYVEDNPIYHSQRNLEFVFDDIRKEPVLREYEIYGTQKMIFKDSVNMHIKSSISF